MATTATDTRLLTAREVAELLGVTPLTVRRLASGGVLPAVRFVPTSRLRFRARDVEALIENGAALEGESTHAAEGGAAATSTAAARPTDQGGNE